MIRTTHVGSLPRPEAVAALLFARERGEGVDALAWRETMAGAVRDAVSRQRAAGIDIPSDGEMSKISYATYVKDRLTGFDGDSPRSPPADLEAFPNFLKRQARSGGTPSYRRPRCVGPVAVADLSGLDEDIAIFRAALDSEGYAEGFMNAASPGVIALFQPSDYHADQDAYLSELASAMRTEYRRIVDAGLLLQIDAPDLGLGRHMLYKHLDEAAFLRRAARHVEALNDALDGIDPARVRLHVCWGNYEGPHTHDVPLATILPVLLQARAGTILFEAANPRHEHEWRAWAGATLPAGLVLAPGVIDSTTNFVEHPRLVADRIERYVRLFGAERIIAGTDCGFATFAGFGAVDPDIAWAKLASLGEGARLASAAA